MPIKLPTTAEVEAHQTLFRRHMPPPPTGSDEFAAFDAVAARVGSDGTSVLLRLADTSGLQLNVILSPVAASMLSNALAQGLAAAGFTSDGAICVSDPENAQRPASVKPA